ncbi:hypothetical protein D3C84_136110 [compost metagenome]
MVRSGEALSTVMPIRVTSSGSLGWVRVTRFCTCTWALSRSVPRAKVMVRVILPSAVDCEDMYSMFSTPVMACSNGAATLSPMTLGLAPGKLARTTTVGGTTSGYSLIGSWNSEMLPAIRISSDSTAAKIGRVIKNLEKFIGPVP